MNAHSISKLISSFLCFIFLTLSVFGQDAADGRKKQPHVRLICVASLEEDQEIVLATKDEKGEWSELAKAKLRSPLISDWLPAKEGKLSLALRGAEGLAEIGSFTFPAGTQRAVVVIFPDGGKEKYRAEVFVPSKLGFVKGSTLVINYSRLPGAVALGSFKTNVQPGKNKVVKPVTDTNGMFRLLVAYQNENKETVVCHDRYLPLNKESRDILFLLPDQTLGLRVFSLSEFGPFE